MFRTYAIEYPQGALFKLTQHQQSLIPNSVRNAFKPSNWSTSSFSFKLFYFRIKNPHPAWGPSFTTINPNVSNGLDQIQEDKYLDLQSSQRLNNTGNSNFQPLNCLASSTSNIKTSLLSKPRQNVPIKRLTQIELQARSDKGLNYTCDEKFSRDIKVDSSYLSSKKMKMMKIMSQQQVQHQDHDLQIPFNEIDAHHTSCIN